MDDVLIEFIETYTVAVSQLGNGGRYKTRNQKTCTKLMPEK